MQNTTKFLEAFKKNWYIQGFNASPIFLTPAALSGIDMHDTVGFGYTDFLLYYKDGYCEYGYDNNDFDEMWQIIKQKLEADPDYLKKMRDLYEKKLAEAQPLYDKISQNPESFSDEEILPLIKQALQALVHAVGIAHMIEPIGINLETQLKEQLEEEVNADEKKLNEYFALLSSPTTPSFLAQEEASLFSISQLPEREQEQAIAKHIDRFFWVHTSYVGANPLTIKALKERLAQIEAHKLSDIANQKSSLIKGLKLSEAIQRTSQLIDFSVSWQDDRKGKILETIALVDRMFKELSKRTSIPVNLLHQLLPADLETIGSTDDLRAMEQELRTRKNGMFLIVDRHGEHSAIGYDFETLMPEYQKYHLQQEQKDFRGTTANRGTATGRVVICRGVESLNNVQLGDIIVASMTRPEFMPALKKASAIVTDEGGVTCHAAIVSRELGIPAVIGTKIATKILKDGDIIEVRANHGLVKIL